VRGTSKGNDWVIKGADRDTQIADGKVGFRNVPPMPEKRAVAAECRIRAPLIDALHGPFSADDRIPQQAIHDAFAVAMRYMTTMAVACKPKLSASHCDLSFQNERVVAPKESFVESAHDDDVRDDS
jgi:hypothetical protein